MFKVDTCPWCKSVCGSGIDILCEPSRWARWHYDRGSGSLIDLKDFSNRYILATRLNNDPAASESVKDALHYLLKTPGELR